MRFKTRKSVTTCEYTSGSGCMYLPGNLDEGVVKSVHYGESRWKEDQIFYNLSIGLLLISYEALNVDVNLHSERVTSTIENPLFTSLSPRQHQHRLSAYQSR